MITSLFHVDEEGFVIETPLPTKWEICSACRGEGSSTLYLGDVTDAIREDLDFAEDYFSGRYNRACNSCSGTGKVRVVDLKALTPAQKKAFEEACEEEYHYNQMCEMERRMGA